MPAGGSGVLALLLVAATQAPQTSQSPPPTGLLLGRVVDAATGRPVVGAIVAIQGGLLNALNAPRAVTNGGGQFVFRKLPKGSFNLVASKPGYVQGAYGRHQPGGSMRVVELDEGQRVGDVTITIWRHAAIGGSVVDEAGEPVIGVTLRLFQRRYVAGHRRYMPAGTASTDDRGVYRFAALAPGEYVVAFISHQVSVPEDVAELFRTPPVPSDAKAQDLMRERMSLGPYMGPPGSQQSAQFGSTIRQIDISAPVPPISGAGPGPVFIYPTLFFPNSPTAARAGVITVQSGQERDGVDLSLHPVRALRVSGTLAGGDGPVSNVAVHLVPAVDDDVPGLEPAATMTDGNGNFTLTGVVAGQYIIGAARIPRQTAPSSENTVTTQIQVGGGMFGMSMPSDAPGPPSVPPIPDDPALYADTPVAVADADVNDVVVMLQHGGRLSGRVEFDGTRDRPDATALPRIPIILERADSAGPTYVPGQPGMMPVPPGRVDEKGAFKTYGQPPGRYLLRVGAPFVGWVLKSTMLEGRDISEVAFDLGTSDISNIVITFTDRPTKLTGVVRTKDGNPDTEALVVAFPIDPSAWSDYGNSSRRVRSTRPTNNGTYTINGLPAGDYYVASISENGVSQWQDPQVLADLVRSAAQVRLVDGDTRTQDVVRSGGDR